MDIREQLEQLRRTVAAIDDRYRSPAPVPPPAFIETLVSGEVVETPHGRHFEMEKLFARHERHGSCEISDLNDWPADLLAALSADEIPDAEPGSIAFLDTETTGLAGGAGAAAFLIGVGSIHPEGFRVRQFFLRDFDEEASALHALSGYLARFSVMVTYNGRSYDQPLLETRYTISRARHPFGKLEHLDLLYGARRLFKLRLESCRLVNLECEILGFERGPDIPGELIPYTYFEYLRTKRAHRLLPVFHHNVLDIVSLACLTGIVPQAFRDPENVRARHGSDLLGLARWLLASGRAEEALRMMRRAIEKGLPDDLLFRALFEAGSIEKKLGLENAALATFTDLTVSPNPWRVRAFEELAIHYEHRRKNFSMALECVLAARELADSEALAHRQMRLERKCSRRGIPQPALNY